MNAKLLDQYFHNINSIIQTSYVPYFVTTCFSDPFRKTLQSTQVTTKKIEYIQKQYAKFYRHLTSNLMTYFTKKLRLHPRTYDFVDFPSTRHGRTISLTLPNAPHVHSIYLVHPDTHDRFDILRSDNFTTIREHPSQSAVISIDCQPIGPTEDDLKRVISYSAKFLSDPRAQALDANAPLTNQFPIHPDELKKRKTPQERFYTCNKDFMMQGMNKYLNKKFKFQRKEHDNEFTIR